MLAFDHVVVLSNNPEQAQQSFAQQYNIIGTKGGEHQEWGTFNYLAFFHNITYIEWIGVQNSEVMRQSTNPLIRQLHDAVQHKREGVIQFALRTNNLDSIQHYWEEHHIPYEGPFAGSRTKPDGTTMKWRMLFPTSSLDHEVLPFLIEWDEQPNIPDDDNLLNPRNFECISVGVDQIQESINKWKKIYPFKEATNNPSTWLLANGKLVFTEERGIRIKMEHMDTF
ncbi:VOC family protein [Pontibacillus litoralis]|uniref:Glyoxalase-like domain-containing protein n=1 Tax=Pontibacillus litoralis JSM 072002 TaxID=1385512 RepID=A0A0A5G3H5_9BACI|nr:VOC family protein [Pontibacillus litoralis]KGX86579.1 hypothetical protein N784_04180 [Pontibacillus litoralis JSM 072002]